MFKSSVAIIAVVFSAVCFAVPILPDSGQVTLKLNDNSVVNVKTCEDFIRLREQGKTIIDYPNLPDRFIQDTADLLVACYLKTHAENRGYVEVKPSTLAITIHDVVNHFPAYAGVVISNSAVDDIEKNYTGKSISQWEPDLKFLSDDRAESKKNADGYYLSNTVTYKDKNGSDITYVTLVKYVIGGTWEAVDTYKIKSMESKIWQLEEITVNSPL